MGVMACRMPECENGGICCFECDETCKCDWYDSVEYAVDCEMWLEEENND